MTRHIYVLLTLFSTFVDAGPAQARPTCGPLVQTQWTAGFDRRTLTYHARYRHPARTYCARTRAVGTNATAELLDAKRRVILAQPVSVPVAQFYDGVTTAGAYVGGQRKLASVGVRVEFPDGAIFRRGRYLRLKIPGAPTLGPAELR